MQSLRGIQSDGGLESLPEEEEQEDDDDSRSHRHINRKVVNLSDLLLDMPVKEKWEQPVSTAVAKPGEVNRNTGPKVLEPRPKSGNVSTSKAGRRVSHLFIPDKALLPAEVAGASTKKTAGASLGVPLLRLGDLEGTGAAV